MATTKATNLGHRSDVTLRGTTTTVESNVVLSDTTTINNGGSDVGLKINSTSSGHIMQLQDSGTDVMVVKDGGNVGIGDNNPSEKLVISDNTASQFASVIKNTHASGAGMKVFGATGTQYSFIVRDYTDNTNSLVVLGNGKVGIGGSPSSTFTVNDSGAGAGTSAVFIDQTGGVNDVGSGLHVRTKIADSTDTILKCTSTTSTTTRFLVRSDGRVGIGTDSPGDLFTVESTSVDAAAITISHKVAQAANTGPRLKFYNAVQTGAANTYLAGDIRVLKNNGTSNNHDHYMSFRVRKNSPEGTYEVFKLGHNGNLSGTASSVNWEISGYSSNIYFKNNTSGGNIYATGGDGVHHQISPHNFSLIPNGPSEELAWAYYAEHNKNPEDGNDPSAPMKKINVDMARVVRLVEQLSGETLIYTNED